MGRGLGAVEGVVRRGSRGGIEWSFLMMEVQEQINRPLRMLMIIGDRRLTYSAGGVGSCKTINFFVTVEAQISGSWPYGRLGTRHEVIFPLVQSRIK